MRPLRRTVALVVVCVWAATLVWISWAASQPPGVGLGVPTTGPVAAVAQPVRLLVAALSMYLLAGTALEAAAGVAPALKASVAWLRGPLFVRRVVSAALGAALASAPAPAGADGAIVQVITSHDEVQQPDRARPTAPPLTPPPSIERTRGAARPAAAVRDEPPAQEWTVRPGDHLWAIAEAVSTPHDVQVDRVWHQLIDINSGRLVDPANPDLIIPGQRLLIPRPPRR